MWRNVKDNSECHSYSNSMNGLYLLQRFYLNGHSCKLSLNYKTVMLPCLLIIIDQASFLRQSQCYETILSGRVTFTIRRCKCGRALYCQIYSLQLTYFSSINKTFATKTLLSYSKGSTWHPYLEAFLAQFEGMFCLNTFQMSLCVSSL